MLPELSLHVLDIVENSTKANATLVTIIVSIQTSLDLLTITIKDNGCGMSLEQISKVKDPFFTTRTTRKVGLGVPFFQLAAETANGSFHIESKEQEGTTVCATFQLSHIDRMPLGDMNATIHQLILMHPNCDFLYRYEYNNGNFILDTREFRKILGDIPFDTPEVSTYIKQYLSECEAEVIQGQNTTQFLEAL